MKLSHRLQTIYNQSLPGQPLWDLCCDHGQLGLYAYEDGKCSEVNFVDQVPSIMENLEHTYHTRHHDETSALKTSFTTLDAGKITASLTGTLIIAGVGGLNMHHMLMSLQNQGVLNASRLVLSPHRDEALYEAADWLFSYQLVDKRMVVENGIRYIFTFDRILH